MNSNQRRIYEQQHLKKITSFERKFMKPVYAALKSFNIKFANLLRERGLEATKQQLNKTQLNDKIGPVIRDIYIMVGIYHANRTYNQIIRSAIGKVPTPKQRMLLLQTKDIPYLGVPGGQINFNDKWRNDILDYFRMFLIDKAVLPITISQKEAISRIFDIGLAEGWTIERMAKELETDQYLLYQTRRVIRTETAKAANYGRRIGAVDSPFESQKEWISAHDNRTRHGHRDMDGETIDTTQNYAVPLYKGEVFLHYEMMTGPGDPNASAGNVINCRCTEGYNAKRDENGRLMRKPTNRVSVIQPNQINRPNITVTI